MALDARNVPEALVYSLVAAHNQKQLDEISTTYFHQSRLETTSRPDFQNQSVTRVTVTAANATNEATSVTLVNNIKDVIDSHFTDAVAHDTATSAVITIADATNAATAITLANDLKAKYNTHLSASNVHFNDDATNDVTNANATDQTTLNTLVNEIKGDVNAHVASAPPGTYINTVPA